MTADSTAEGGAPEVFSGVGSKIFEWCGTTLPENQEVTMIREQRRHRDEILVQEDGTSLAQSLRNLRIGIGYFSACQSNRLFP